MTTDIEEILRKYGVRDAKDLESRLEMYEYLATHRYHAIERDTYEAMIRDCKELQRMKAAKTMEQVMEKNDGE